MLSTKYFKLPEVNKQKYSVELYYVDIISEAYGLGLFIQFLISKLTFLFISLNFSVLFISDTSMLFL